IYRAALHSSSSSRLFPTPAPPEIYTLSLHDALPISQTAPSGSSCAAAWMARAHSRRLSIPFVPLLALKPLPRPPLRRQQPRCPRSEEHTSELQSRENLVCRLLLEKKKKHLPAHHLPL